MYNFGRCSSELAYLVPLPYFRGRCTYLSNRMIFLPPLLDVKRMWGVYFIGGGQFILRPFSHFEMQDFKNSKLFACSALISNILIFRFMMDAGPQVDIDFNTKFSCLSSCFFSPLTGHSKPTKPMKLLSFLSICWV